MMTIQDVSKAVESQRSWRASCGLSSRVFPIQALVELLANDVSRMRVQGRSDQEICEIIFEATARRVRPADLVSICGHAYDLDTPRESLRQ